MKYLSLSRRAVGTPSSAVPFGLLAMVLSVIIPGVGGASELERRLEGTWAASAKDCEAYLSGRLNSDDMDQSTRRRFGVATIRNGLFSYKYQMAASWAARGSWMPQPFHSTQLPAPRHERHRHRSGALFQRRQGRLIVQGSELLLRRHPDALRSLMPPIRCNRLQQTHPLTDRVISRPTWSEMRRPSEVSFGSGETEAVENAAP